MRMEPNVNKLGKFLKGSTVTSVAIKIKQEPYRFQFDIANSTDSDFINLKVYLNGMRTDVNQKLEIRSTGTMC